MSKMTKQLELVISETYNSNIFNKILEVIDNFYEYLAEAKNYTHRVIYKQHLQAMLLYTPEKQTFLITIFQLGLHFGSRKETSAVKKITSIIRNACFCYQNEDI